MSDTDLIDAQVVEPPAPAPTPPTEPKTAMQAKLADEEEEGDLVDDYEDLFDLIEKQLGRVSSKGFMENMQKAFAVQTVREFRMNTYEVIKKVIAVGGKTAIELERLGADFEDLKDEVVKHTRLFNDLMSTSIITHALNLSRLCLERVQDVEIRNLAQAIFNSMHPTTTEAAAAATAAVTNGTPAPAPQVQP